MFKKVEIPILGVVENMSYYVCPACGHHDEIFARGGGKKLAAASSGRRSSARCRSTPRCGTAAIRGGRSSSARRESEHAKIFMTLAARVAGEIAKVNGPSGGTGRRAAGLVQIR